MDLMNLINLLSIREKYQFLVDEYGCPDAYGDLDDIDSYIYKIINKWKTPYSYKIEVFGIEFELE